MVEFGRPLVDAGLSLVDTLRTDKKPKKTTDDIMDVSMSGVARFIEQAESDRATDEYQRDSQAESGGA